MDDDLLFEIENFKNMFNPRQEESEGRRFRNPRNILSDQRDTSLLLPILIELIHLVKSTFGSINNLALISRGKFSDREFGDYFSRSITEDAKRIDLLLDGILDYIKLSAIIPKTNTVHALIEELLKKNQVRLEEKNIRLFKKFEKELPETAIPEDQLTYILNTVLQYAINIIPANGSIGFLTKSSMPQRGVSEEQVLFRKDDHYVEILIQFTGHRMQTEEFQKAPQIQMDQSKKLMNFESVLDLELRLMEDIVKRNRGMSKLEVDEKKSRTSILLRFPVERRKGVFYQPVN